MLFRIFQLLESIGITDNLLCLISDKWPNSLFFLIISRLTGFAHFFLNRPVPATNRPLLSVLSKYASLITSTTPTISLPIFE